MATGDINYLTANNTDCTIEDENGINQRGIVAVDPQVAGTIEDFTGYVAVIDSDHAYIHKGLAFTTIIDTGTISSAYRIGFKTPTAESGKDLHWRPINLYSTLAGVRGVLTEADTYTGGTVQIPFNRNRDMKDELSVIQDIKKGVTATPTGVEIDSFYIGSAGNPSQRSGGSDGANEELLLAPDTDYVLTLTPSGNTVCYLNLFWYEEDEYIV